MPDLRTDRLTLRPWRESDVQPWAAMNADPQVREHLGDLLTREQSAASIAHFQAQLDERGYGFWTVEVHGTGEFIGFTGLDQVDEGMPFAGIEIGWAEVGMLAFTIAVERWMEADNDEPFPLHAAAALSDLQVRAAELDSRPRLSA
jgi:RimJ/RimL family protein N-acetyltransferase